MSAWPVPALVLTAGLGTRLRPLTFLRAKPALPVGDDPLIVHILRGLAAQGVRDAVLNLHYKPESVARAVGDGTGTGLRVRYTWEQPRVLGSAGGIRHALPLIEGETLLVVNGDSLCDLPVRALVEAHFDRHAAVTLGLMPHPVAGKYGGVQVTANGRVAGFTRRDAAEPSWHFPGIQVVQRDVFAHLPDDEPAESIGRLYPALMRTSPEAVRGHVCEARWLDVGTVDDYRATCAAVASDADGNTIASTARVAPDAHLRETIVWPGAQVGAACRLTRCVVTDTAVVAPGTVATDEIFSSASC